MTQVHTQAPGFTAPRKFFDDDNFPYGFRRSGEFTPRQAELLERHGLALKALASGKQAPATQEEADFVACCRGERLPETELEKAWTRYTRVCQTDKGFYTLCDSRQARSDNRLPRTDTGLDAGGSEEFDDFDDN